MPCDVELADLKLPAVHASPPRRRSVRRSHTGNAVEAIGPLSPGCEVFALTSGEFSMVDVLRHVLDHTGPAAVDLATWTAADGDLRRAHAFLLEGRITRLRFLVDPSFRSRKPEFCAVLVDLFGNDAIRTMPLHGKFATLRNDTWNVAIRSSMNLNLNKRIESVEISDDAMLAGFLADFVDEAFAASSDANFASQSLGKLSRHGTGSRLAF